jgi:hypothetical protein
MLHICCSSVDTYVRYINKGNAKRGVSLRLKIRPCDLDLWPWKSIGFQILLRSKYVPSLVKIHWRMLILECSQGCYAVTIWPGDIDLWPMTLKINRVPDSHKDYVCTKFGQNPLKDLDSTVFTRMLCGKNLTRWPSPLTLKINRVPGSPKDYVCTKFGQNPLKDVDSRVFTRMLCGKNLTYDLENQ